VQKVVNHYNMRNSALTMAGLALLSASGCQVFKNKELDRPNILFIFADDHSFQTLSAYDNRFIETPNLDRIAHDGIIFANSFVGNSICAPSRATLLTGKHSHANGQFTNAEIFDGSQQTFPQLLQQGGYHTALIGKWHLQSDPTGFDYWKILPGQGHYYNPDFIKMGKKGRYEGYVTNLITDFSIKWLEEQWDNTRPFLLKVHHKAAHRSWMPDTTHLDEFKDMIYPLPPTFFDNHKGRIAAAQQRMSFHTYDMDLVYDLKMADPENQIQTALRSWYITGEYGRMTTGQRRRWHEHYLPIISDFKKANLYGNELSEWKYQRFMQDYLACVRSLDENVGRLLAYLEKKGILENTLVVYTSDQGFFMGEHGWFDKRFMYEESFRTPLIMRLPKGFERRGRVTELVQNIDLAPTFIEIAGLEVPQNMHGRSLVPIMTRYMGNEWREAVYYHYYEYPGEHSVKRHFGIRDSRYKLIRFYYDIDAWEFYDLEKDPFEINNAYSNSEYASIINELKIHLRHLIEQYNDDLALGILDGQGYFRVAITPMAALGKLFAVLDTDVYDGEIVYTLDGSLPDINSRRYSGPVEITRSVIFNALTLKDGQLVGLPAVQRFIHHKASGADVVYQQNPNPRFMAQEPNLLTDGLRGSINLRPNWHGFQGQNMVALIDLGEIQPINSIALGTLQLHSDWVFVPQRVMVEVSLDGKTYREAGIASPPIVNGLPQIVDFTLKFDALQARYLRITAINLGLCPPGHVGQGQPAWLFVDEIIVE